MTHTSPTRAGTPHRLDPQTLGQRLRTARKQFGWTLAQLAQRAGISITTISRAERGQLALGYENVAALAQALQLDIGALFADDANAAGTAEGPVVTRAGQGVSYRGSSFTYEFLATAATGKPINPVLGTIRARRIHGPEDFARHAGVEFVYVLSGKVEVHFENGEIVSLDRGDSLYFDSRIGHAYVSVSQQLARVIGVITAESSHIVNARRGQESATERPPAATHHNGTGEPTLAPRLTTLDHDNPPGRSANPPIDKPTSSTQNKLRKRKII